jgi:sulfide:quinone oxidoreductase
MKHIVILGAGTAGTMMAHTLSRSLPDREWRISVLDRDDVHVYQPGLLLVPFGDYRPDEVIQPRRPLLPTGVTLNLSGIERIDSRMQKVHAGDGEVFNYDFLILATGTRIVPEETEGLTGEGWFRDAFDFYTLEGAAALAERLDGFEKGRLVVNVADMPIKCPVAPLEFVFLADAYFTRRGLRDQVDIVFATPLDGAFTKPRASAALGDLLTRRGIGVVTDFVLESVDGAAKKMASYDGQTLDYDLLVSVPLHRGAEVVSKSGLGDESGFFPTDPRTLVARNHERIFALGDATDCPTSKAGSVAHFQAEVLTENIRRVIAGRAPLPEFDGHANCFIETGHEKALLIDFNYETEPLPGRFPLPGIGPFTLLEESHVNHWGKLAFRSVYWNLLLRGKPLPVTHQMQMAGKWR